MRRFLHYVTLLYGVLEVLIGVIKLFVVSPEFTLEIMGMYLRLPVFASIFYLIPFNLIGGLVMCWYSVYTLRQLDNRSEEKKSFKTASSLAGIYIVFLALWELIFAIAMLTKFENGIMHYLPLFVLCLVLFIPKALFPMILVYVNSISPVKKNKKPNR